MQSASAAIKRNLSITVLFAIAILSGCAAMETENHPLRSDAKRNPRATTTPAPAVADTQATAPRKAPGKDLADMLLDFARAGKVEPMREYFVAGYSANFSNERGDTPLILAAYHGHADAVRLILHQPDAGLNQLNQMGFTALTGASFKGDLAIMRLLIDAGADVNATGSSGKTPLMFAALTNREAAAELLLASGADPAAKATDGSTAASLAAGQGSPALAERLGKVGR